MPYELYLTIDTDDDAQIEYLGKKYCFYAPDLHVLRRFKTKKECTEHLREVKVKQGDKASEYIQQLLDDVISGETESIDVSGNQIIVLAVREVDSMTYGVNASVTLDKALALLKTAYNCGQLSTKLSREIAVFCKDNNVSVADY